MANLSPVIKIAVKGIITSAINFGKLIDPIIDKLNQGCPPKAELDKFIQKRNNSVNSLNQIRSTLSTIQSTANAVNGIITALDIAIKVAKFIPFPPFFPGGKVADILIGLQKFVKRAKDTIQQVAPAIAIITSIIISIIDKLNAIDVKLLECVKNQAKTELAFNPKKEYKKGNIVVKSKNPPPKANNNEQGSEGASRGRDLNPQAGGISKTSEINNFKTDSSNAGFNEGNNNANIGDEINPNTGEIINEENINISTGTGGTGGGGTGTGTEGIGTGTGGTGIGGIGTGGGGTGAGTGGIGTGTGGTGTGTGGIGTGGTETENTDINKPNITLSKQNQINSPKIITENTKVIQDLNSLGIDTTNLIPNLNNAILNLINSPIGTQGVINEDGTFSITSTIGTGGTGIGGTGTGTGGTGIGGIGTGGGGTGAGTGGTGIGDEDNETNILVSTEPNTDKTLIEKTSINQNLEGTGISITISNLPLQIEDKYYKALEDNIDKDPEDPNNSKIWEEITEEEALEIYFNNLGLIETPNDILSTTENEDINLDPNKILENSLKPGAVPPFKYKDFIFILENDKENKLSVPRRRIVATRETDKARIEGDYSFSATTQILVDETKFLVDRFLDDGLNLIYNNIDIRLKQARDLIS